MISGSPPVIDIELVPVADAEPGVVAAAPAVAPAVVSRATSPPAVAVVALSALFALPPLRPHAPAATSDAHIAIADKVCHRVPTILPPAPEVACTLLILLHSARHLREHQDAAGR